MPICKHCGEPIYQTRGGSWVHADGRGICSWAEPADPWPDTEDAAAAHYAACNPEPADPVRCPKCGGPHPFHDPACVVHPDIIQDQPNGRSER